MNRPVEPRARARTRSARSVPFARTDLPLQRICSRCSSVCTEWVSLPLCLCSRPSVRPSVLSSRLEASRRSECAEASRRSHGLPYNRERCVSVCVLVVGAGSWCVPVFVLLGSALCHFREIATLLGGSDSSVSPFPETELSIELPGSRSLAFLSIVFLGDLEIRDPGERAPPRARIAAELNSKWRLIRRANNASSLAPVTPSVRKFFSDPFGEHRPLPVRFSKVRRDIRDTRRIAW